MRKRLQKKLHFLFIDTCYSLPAGNMQERSGPLCQGMGTFSRFSCSSGVGKGAEVGGEKGGKRWGWERGQRWG